MASLIIGYLADRLRSLIPSESDRMVASLNSATRYTQMLDECIPVGKSLYCRTREGRVKFGVHPFFIDLGKRYVFRDVGNFTKLIEIFGSKPNSPPGAQIGLH